MKIYTVYTAEISSVPIGTEKKSDMETFEHVHSMMFKFSDLHYNFKYIST